MWRISPESKAAEAATLRALKQQNVMFEEYKIRNAAQPTNYVTWSNPENVLRMSGLLVWEGSSSDDYTHLRCELSRKLR